MFQYMFPRWWNFLGRIRKYDLVDDKQLAHAFFSLTPACRLAVKITGGSSNGMGLYSRTHIAA